MTCYQIHTHFARSSAAKVGRSLVATLFATFIAVSGAKAEDAAKGAPDRETLAVHSQCNRAATSRVLTGAQAVACSRAFLEIKLSFLSDVTLEELGALEAAERAKVNRRGYEAYQLWLADAAEGGRYLAEFGPGS